MIPYLAAVSSIGPLVYWASTLAAIVASACLCVCAVRIPRRGFVVASAATLAGALLLVALPHPGPIPIVSTLIGVAALAASVIGGGPAVLTVLGLAERGGVTDGRHGGIMVTSGEGTEMRGREVLRGGTTIGLFERFATTGAIIAGFPEAIAAIIAIKGVGRFTELDAAEARERFIIGTLVSLVWACACGALVHFAAA